LRKVKRGRDSKTQLILEVILQKREVVAILKKSLGNGDPGLKTTKWGEKVGLQHGGFLKKHDFTGVIKAVKKEK